MRLSSSSLRKAVLPATLFAAVFIGASAERTFAEPGSPPSESQQQARASLSRSPVLEARSLNAAPQALQAVSFRTAAAAKSVELYNEISNGLFYVSHIQFEGLYRLSEREVSELAGLSRAPAVWEVRPAEVRARLLRNPWIESVEIETHPYPAAMKISIKEAEPWIIAEYERHSWLVSRNGNLIQALDTLNDADIILETTELPRLDGLGSTTEGTSGLSSSNARFVHAVKLIKLFRAAGELPFQIMRYTLLPGGGLKIQSAAPDAPEIFLSAENHDDARQRVQRLTNVLADLDRRGEKPKRIDLRFQNQAIVE